MRLVHHLNARQLSAVCLVILLSGCTGISSFAEIDCKAPPELESGAARDATGLTNLGTWFGQHDQFECANHAFRAALKLDPASAKVNYFLGVSLYSSGQLDAAVAPLRQSAQLDTRTARPGLLLATVLQQLGRKPEAAEAWRAVLQIDPASPEALDGLSRSMIESGDFMAAIQMLRNAKRDEDLTLDLAAAYGSAGMLEEAGATVQDALAANAESIRLTNALATVYVRQKRYQDAAVLLKGYLDRHPADFQSQMLYLRVLVLTDDTENARPLGRKLLAGAPHDFDVLYLNGILEREAGEYAAARDHLLEAVTLKPEDYSARYNLGAALAHLEDTAGARRELEKAIALDGAQAEAHFQLAAVLRAQGDSPAAQEQLKSYQELSRASVAHSLADTKAEQAAQKLSEGDAQQAAKLYREAVAATPENTLLNYRLAMALQRSGDAAGERAALEQTVKLDPSFALAQNELGYLIFHGGAAGEAEGHFRAAVKAAPAFADAWINLAATLASESHFSEAQDAVATALRLDPQNAQALELGRQLTAAAHR